VLTSRVLPGAESLAREQRPPAAVDQNKIDSVDIVEAEENLGALNADAQAMPASLRNRAKLPCGCARWRTDATASSLPLRIPASG
jgi:hypothetical protein